MITNLEELKNIRDGEEVKLSGWGVEPFICKLKRPSLLTLAQNKAIPNTLLSAAQKVFRDRTNEVSLVEQGKILDIVAKAAMVEPTFEELEFINLKLTDMQLMEIFTYTQVGLKGLEKFRPEPTDSEDNSNGKRVSKKAK